MTVNQTFGEYEISTDQSGGKILEIRHRPTGRSWTLDKGRVNGIQMVTSANDLPPAENGVRTLDSDANGYMFCDFIADPATLDLNGVPVVGFHGGAGGYIHTGGDVAFQTRGTSFSVDNFYGHAPGGQLFDLQADNTTRFYVTDSAFFDAVGMGDIADLGVVDGYKVQSFKSVNFENFAQGLTAKGDPDKVFFDTCPIREVDTAGSTFFTADADFSPQILKFIGCYVKNVRSDTAVVDLSASGLPSEYFKYINVDHDTTVDKTNVFKGFTKKDTGVLVVNSFPIANSSAHAELGIDDSNVTVAGSGASLTRVTETNVNSTFTLNNPERFQKVATDGAIEYTGKSDIEVDVTAKIAMSGSNTSFNVVVGYNGSPVTRTSTPGYLASASEADSASALGNFEISTGDTFSVFVENSGGTQDLDAVTMTLTVDK